MYYKATLYLFFCLDYKLQICKLTLLLYERQVICLNVIQAAARVRGD